MEYTVTYRDETGKIARMTYVAESRKACLSEFKSRRGISVISITEGASDTKRSRIDWLLMRRFPFPLITFAIVISAGLCVLYFVDTDEGTPPKTDKISSSRLATVKPTTNHIAKPQEAKNFNPNRNELKNVATNKWGHPKHWGTIKLHAAHTSFLARTSMPLEERIFQRRVDRGIAGLLVIEPGTDLIGTDDFGDDFTRSFLRSLNYPIIVEDDDPEDVKEIKQAVIDTKKELKALHDKGEDIAEIMRKTRKELRELGLYREELRKEIDKFRKKDGTTIQDMEDIVNAANLMLKERGIKEIAYPEMLLRGIKIREQRKANNK